MTQSKKPQPLSKLDVEQSRSKTKKLVKAAQHSPEALQKELDLLFPGTRPPGKKP